MNPDQTNQNTTANSTPAAAPAASTTPADATPKKSTGMAMLAYVGPLVILSYIMAKDDTFTKFHIKQGLVLLVIEVAVWVLGMAMFFPLWVLLRLVNLATLILAIVGIINASKGREQKLPLVGDFAKHFNF